MAGPAEQIVGYRYHAFLSYSRAQRWPTFVDEHFRPVLDHWLGAELGQPARVFQDSHSVSVGERWPRQIARGLAGSRVMVALLSRDYFASEWCLRELAAMLWRANWFRDQGLDDQIIFPLAIHDCDPLDLPEVVRSLQIISIHDLADPFMHPRSRRRELLSQKLRPLCGTIARMIEQVPDETHAWPLADSTKYRELLGPVTRSRSSIPVLGSIE